MAGGKATPRQKMINMMYLVLTALLALNVSKEILNAFVIMNDGLTDTRLNLEKKNSDLLKIFEESAKTQPKYKAAYDKSKEIHVLADNLNKEIEKMKIDLLKESDGPETESVVGDKIVLAKLGKKDDYDTPTRVMVGGEGNPPGKGVDLKKKLRDYVNTIMTKYIDPRDKEKLKSSVYINTEDKPDPEEPEINTWEAKIFHHAPMAAAIAHLSKIQGDVRKVESEAIGYLFSAVTARQVSFDKFKAMAIVNDGFIFTGSTTEMTIGLGAYDSSQKLKIKLNGNMVGEDKIKDGVAVIPISGSSVGEQTMKGEIFVFDPEKNAEVPYPFETRYTVGAPMATVSPTKMNVFYIGVDNPVDITVSGVSAANVLPSVTGGSISGSGGHYVVKVNGAPGTKAMVNVSAKMPDGTTKAMGKMEFRVKRVPDPVAMYLGSKGGPMPLNQVKAGQGINCVLENFDFDLKFNITSFTLGANINGNFMEESCAGPAFSGKAKDILGRLKTGNKVFFDNIKAKGPDGTSRTLQSFFVTCK